MPPIAAALTSVGGCRHTGNGCEAVRQAPKPEIPQGWKVKNRLLWITGAASAENGPKGGSGTVDNRCTTCIKLQLCNYFM